MKQRLRQCRPHEGWTLDTLRVAIFETWEELHLEDYQKVIDSMPERLREVVRRNGGQTGY